VRALLVDRDGVINHDTPDFIRSPADWRALPGSLEALATAYRAGYHVVVVSNQSGLARGLLSAAQLNAIHQHLCLQLARFGGRIEAFFFCPHAPEEGCTCRKPQPGLLLAAARRFGIDLARTAFIGDRASDILAARRAGAQPILVRTGREPVTVEGFDTFEVFDDLRAAITALL
jgi:D-glycero-D-manno-heptose 1,7-bisphosphate phosphatase